jgi:Co/Zn/Cd efflux system component
MKETENSTSCHASHCGHDPVSLSHFSKMKHILWIAFWVNFSMFFVEVGGSFYSGSEALLADALDFIGDAANYLLAIFVLEKNEQTKIKMVILKGFAMISYSGFVLCKTGYDFFHGGVPESFSMGAIAVVALAANVFVAALLYAFRSKDLNMRSVWLCSRNDAIGNVAIIVSAILVYFFQAAWPDWLVAIGMAMLGLWTAKEILTSSKKAFHAHNDITR